MIGSRVSYTGYYVKIEANQPDIKIKIFEENTCIMIDVTVPADENNSLKEFKKLSKYKDLKI